MARELLNLPAEAINSPKPTSAEKWRLCEKGQGLQYRTVTTRHIPSRYTAPASTNTRSKRVHEPGHSMILRGVGYLLQAAGRRFLVLLQKKILPQVRKLREVDTSIA